VADGLVDLWRRLALRYGGQDVAFGLMNEPNNLPASTWSALAKRVVHAIRATGASNLILVPGSQWTGAHSWTRGNGRETNGAAFAGFRDPGGNMAYEMHQYLDADSSGTGISCVTRERAAERLAGATAWLRAERARGFLAEFGGPGDPACLEALRGLLSALEQNGDVWLGWTYWAAGSWWAPSYAMAINPAKGGLERPQLTVLRDYAAH
jgi:endoglucanase